MERVKINVVRYCKIIGVTEESMVIRIERFHSLTHTYTQSSKEKDELFDELQNPLKIEKKTRKIF